MSDPVTSIKENPATASTVPGMADWLGVDMSNGSCTIDGCGNKTVARGWCRPHYAAMWRSGAIETRPHWTATICSVDGCEKQRKGLSWCGMHYARMQRYGSLATPSRRKICSVEGCETFVRGHGWCNAHLLRMQRYGRLDARQYGSDDVSYSAVHYRLKALHGPARNYACIDCGQQAREWSYNHSDSDQRYDDLGMVYSADTAHYVARCKPCHVRFDHAQART
jgi:hypothetical protein